MERKKLDRPILAEGEVTGHLHILEPEVPVDVYDIGNGCREWRATAEIPLKHDEHNTITLPASPTEIYNSGIVLEMDEFEEARKVRD